jgi:hypothetical protein
MRLGFFLVGATLGMIAFTSALEISSSEISRSLECSSLFAQKDSVPFCSQASQDKFVYFILYCLLDKQDKGWYLEIGAGDPIEINNSCFFEKNLQWSGVSVDISKRFKENWQATRTNPLLVEDATQSDYTSILQDFPPVIDYLSLDIDAQYDVVLERLLFNDRVFKIITIEHDAYMHGNLYRTRERNILYTLGYYLLCSNVKHWGKPYEDWWIHPSAFPPAVFFALASLDLHEKEHTQLIQALQALMDD